MGACFISHSTITFKENMTGRLIQSWSQRSDMYSGDWNTIHGISERIKIFDKFTETNLKKFQTQRKYEKLIDDKTEKWSATIFDLGVHHYEVWTPKKVAIPSKEKPVYTTKYVCADGFSDKNKTVAENHAKELILQGYTSSSVKKQQVLVKGSETTTKFELRKRESKSVPKNVKPGSIIREYHYYVVTAFAAE